VFDCLFLTFAVMWMVADFIILVLTSIRVHHYSGGYGSHHNEGYVSSEVHQYSQDSSSSAEPGDQLFYEIAQGLVLSMLGAIIPLIVVHTPAVFVVIRHRRKNNSFLCPDSGRASTVVAWVLFVLSFMCSVVLFGVFLAFSTVSNSSVGANNIMVDFNADMFHQMLNQDKVAKTAYVMLVIRAGMPAVCCAIAFISLIVWSIIRFFRWVFVD